MKNLLFVFAILISSSTILALPGDLDTAFGVKGGYLISDFGSVQRDERHRDTAIQADGKIVVVGTRETATANFFEFLVARYNTDGTPDTTFDGDGYFTLDLGSQFDTANAVAIQTDGKIVVAGGIGESSTMAYVFRLNSDGTLDTAFDTDGIATLSGPGEAMSVVIQTDGKIVFTAAYNNMFTGYSFSVARLNANGSADNTFDGNGQLTISPNVYFPYGLALQTDGKIIVSGTSSLSSVNQNVSTIRLNSNGTYDTTFDGDGIAQTVVPAEDSEARSVAMQNDGKIVIGGASDFGGEDPLLIRLNSNGSLDTSFDGDGIKLFELLNNGQSQHFHEIVPQPDGKIIAVAAYLTDNFPFVTRNDFFIVRVNSDGTNDNSFDANGITKSQWCENGSELALQTDGKIVAVGSRDRVNDSEYIQGICVQRFNADGTVDYSFNLTPSNGKTSFSTDDLIEINAIAGLPSGKILVAGSSGISGGAIEAVLMRLNANGTLDTSFMSEGFYVRTNVSTTNPNIFYDLKIQSDGSFFVTGENQNSGIIIKFTSAGVPDTTFSGDGVVTTTTPARIYGLAIQPDGKLIACGSNGTSIRSGRIARFSATGTLEITASNNLGAGGNNNEILECGLQMDGKIIVAGYGYDSLNANDYISISRHLANFSIDTTFGTSGVTTTNMSSTLNDRATDLVIQPDNKIVISSMDFNANRDFAILRYDVNGTLDPNFTENFGSGGISLIDFVIGSPDDEANALLLQPDGQILVGGMSDNSTSKRFGLAKLNPGGLLTFGFGTLGRTLTTFPNNDSRINALSFYSNDKILAAGKTWNGTDYDFAVARYQNEFIPTAATVSVSGRILTSDGNGVRNVIVTLTAPNGNTLTTRTSSFGYFRFDNIAVGETYVISVASKRFTFNPSTQILSVNEELTNIDFVAEE